MLYNIDCHRTFLERFRINFFSPSLNYLHKQNQEKTLYYFISRLVIKALLLFLSFSLIYAVNAFIRQEDTSRPYIRKYVQKYYVNRLVLCSAALRSA